VRFDEVTSNICQAPPVLYMARTARLRPKPIPSISFTTASSTSGSNFSTSAPSAS
jgi:hypothetical protein